MNSGHPISPELAEQYRKGPPKPATANKRTWIRSLNLRLKFCRRFAPTRVLRRRNWTASCDFRTRTRRPEFSLLHTKLHRLIGRKPETRKQLYEDASTRCTLIAECLTQFPGRWSHCVRQTKIPRFLFLSRDFLLQLLAIVASFRSGRLFCDWLHALRHRAVTRREAHGKKGGSDSRWSGWQFTRHRLFSWWCFHYLQVGLESYWREKAI